MPAVHAGQYYVESREMPIGLSLCGVFSTYLCHAQMWVVAVLNVVQAVVDRAGVHVEDVLLGQSSKDCKERRLDSTRHITHVNARWCNDAQSIRT